MMTNLLTQLTDYEINIRSFHPEKDFGWSGLMFEGDNRQFSLKPSGSGVVTSRIWHRFTLSTKSGAYLKHLTISDPSKAPWKDSYREYDAELKPKGSIVVTSKNISKNVQQHRVNGKYGGVTHAMPGSPEMQKTDGFSYVPTLNVKYKIVLEVDRANGHLDVVTYISGDGFPNCEAFIVGPGGQPVSLGVHVRKGAAPLSLSLNSDYPMIVSAIRLPINVDGSFKGTIGDELSRQASKQPKLKFYKIPNWNQRFISIPASSGHCMLLEKASLKGCFNGIFK